MIDPGGECICPGLSGFRWPVESDPVSGTGAAMVAIYKDQASLRMNASVPWATGV